MAKYLYRTCPKCKDYLGVVVPDPQEPVKVTMNRTLALSAVLCLSLLVAHPAYPWGFKGHEIVGHIAQGSLTDKAWKKVKSILRPQTSGYEGRALRLPLDFFNSFSIRETSSLVVNGFAM